jgi:hypothetical protein
MRSKADSGGFTESPRDAAGRANPRLNHELRHQTAGEKNEYERRAGHALTNEGIANRGYVQLPLAEKYLCVKPQQ